MSSVLSSMSATTGTPMLPPTRVGNPAFSRISPSERGGGGFAVGAGDGEDPALEEAGGQFEFADDGQAEALDLDEFGRVERNAGADDDEVLTAEGEQAVAAGLDHDAFFEQGRECPWPAPRRCARRRR